MKTVDLRLQPDLVGQLALELLDYVDRGLCDFDDSGVAHLLAKLNGLLRVHLAQKTAFSIRR